MPRHRHGAWQRTGIAGNLFPRQGEDDLTRRLPDLFPGFETATVAAGKIQFHCRVGGAGPPLLLLHGYPQSHVCWHRVAPSLAERFTVIAPDLPGYGRTSIPPRAEGGAPAGAPYSKRSMAHALVDMMHVLGHRRFRIAGHDRGGRVAYRMALDHPDRIERIAVLDILPTSDYWDRLDRPFGLKIYHWMFLAQPFPFPENVIRAAPIRFLEHTLASWTGAKTLDCFSAGAMAHNRAWFRDPDRISATCDDYRAGAGIDDAHDRQTRASGQLIEAPLLALWGEKGIATGVGTPLDVWRSWARNAEGRAVPGGHFLPEEAAEDTLAELLRFFSV